MLPHHPIQASQDEQISFFLFSLYQQKNQPSKKLFENLLNWEKEEYLIEHFELIERINNLNVTNEKVYEPELSR